MQQQTDLFFYKFRSLLIGLSTIAFFLLISALITAIGSDSVLATKNSPSSVDSFATPLSDSPNAVTDGANALANGSKRVMLSTGIGLYRFCHSVTGTTAQSGKAVVHGSTTTVGAVWDGVSFVGRGIGSGFAFTFRTAGAAVMFTLHAPGKVVGSVTHTKVSSLIRPADDSNSKKTVPVISSEQTAAILASYNAQQRQQITDWQAAQAVANRGLGGSIVAGDPNHGGYPAKWDNAVQDSRLDSWGMYNRECVSYAAWKVYQTYGTMPYWGGVGNANQWIRDARNAGIATGSAPQVHSVAISMRGYYGHAMWVEKVSGSMIYVSQYNYDLHGHYSEMWVNASSFTYIYFK
jgi:surface antigen